MPHSWDERACPRSRRCGPSGTDALEPRVIRIDPLGTVRYPGDARLPPHASRRRSVRWRHPCSRATWEHSERQAMNVRSVTVFLPLEWPLANDALALAAGLRGEAHEVFAAAGL